MVEVGVRDDDAEQCGVVARRETGDVRQRDVLVEAGGERAADVEDGALSSGLGFDAAAAELLAAAVDADPHVLDGARRLRHRRRDPVETADLESDCAAEGRRRSRPGSHQDRC